MLKDRQSFRLILAAMGIYLLARGFIDGVTTAGDHIQTSPWLVDTRTLLGLFAQYSGPLAASAAGAYLLFGGRLLIEMVTPIQSFCPECGYNLAGTAARKCPECGVPIPPQRSGTNREFDSLACIEPALTARRWIPRAIAAVCVLFVIMCVAGAVLAHFDMIGDCSCSG